MQNPLVSERTESLPYCGVLIKPDTNRQGLYQPIVQEFTSRGFNILGRFDLTLDEDDVSFLYPKEIALPVARRKLISYLTSDISSLVLLEPRPSRSVEQEIKFLCQLKGNKERKTGIRFKYDRIGITDEEIATKTGRYYDYMMINNLHVFDTSQQLFEFMRLKDLQV